MPEFISFPVEDLEIDSDSDESNSTVVNSSQFTFHCNKKIKLSIDDEINNCYENEFFKTLEYDDESFLFPLVLLQLMSSVLPMNLLGTHS